MSSCMSCLCTYWYLEMADRGHMLLCSLVPGWVDVTRSSLSGPKIECLVKFNISLIWLKLVDFSLKSLQHMRGIKQLFN